MSDDNKYKRHNATNPTLTPYFDVHLAIFSYLERNWDDIHSKVFPTWDNGDNGCIETVTELLIPLTNKLASMLSWMVDNDKIDECYYYWVQDAFIPGFIDLWHTMTVDRLNEINMRRVVWLVLRDLKPAWIRQAFIEPRRITAEWIILWKEAVANDKTHLSFDDYQKLEAQRLQG